MIRCSAVVYVTEQSGVAAVRRTVAQCADEMRFGQTAAGRAALVATELATNILKHGDGGSILIGSDLSAKQKLVLIALDKGTGIANVEQAMQDGYSTAGSSGIGLGAMARSSKSLHLYSTPKGTVAVCSIEDPEQHGTIAEDPQALDIAGISLPKRGETECGDSWIAAQVHGNTTIAVADGLGHGPAAATASSKFSALVKERPELTPEDLIREGHGLLRPTRGAAVGVVRLRYGRDSLEFAGVGNIAATVIDEQSTRKVVSHSGIVGHELRKVQTFSYAWTPLSTLVLQSDGIGTGWALEQYPGLAQFPPAVVAAVLFRDYCRGSDDATIVVAKNWSDEGSRGW